MSSHAIFTKRGPCHSLIDMWSHHNLWAIKGVWLTALTVFPIPSRISPQGQWLGHNNDIFIILFMWIPNYPNPLINYYGYHLQLIINSSCGSMTGLEPKNPLWEPLRSLLLMTPILHMQETTLPTMDHNLRGKNTLK